jgi:uncharacterized membrane protein YjgN (DUF898 family)
MKLSKLEIDLSLMDIIGHALLWTLLIIVTLGIGLLFYPYAFASKILNRTYILGDDGRRVGQLQCDLDLSGQIGHVFIWLLLTIITLGLALPVYVYKVWAIVINRTRIVS